MGEIGSVNIVSCVGVRVGMGNVSKKGLIWIGSGDGSEEARLYNLYNSL